MSMTPEEKRARDAERKRRWHEANREKAIEQIRQWRKANKDRDAERTRRKHRLRAFKKEDGSSCGLWLESLTQPLNTFAAIANLQPDPGQTLTELIHELSGYAMEVCEQIANPTVIDDTPALTPPPAEDLF